MSATFLVAKYAPDLERQEPHNIGVIAWTKGRAVSRFIDPTDLDFVKDTANCQRWITHWKKLAAQSRIQVFSERPATINSIRFLKQIKMTCDGNYQLHDGGEVPDASRENLPEVVSFLFDRIVAKVKSPEEMRSPSLQDRCNAFLSDVGLAKLSDFRSRFEVVLTIDGLERAIHFDYGRGDKWAQSLFSRVNLSAENSILLAAGKCETAIKHNKCKREQCFSLYDSSLETGDWDASVHFLGTFSVPVDIGDWEKAARAVQPAIAL